MKRKARYIRIKRDPEERSQDWETPTTAYTRLSRKEYEIRRDIFQEDFPNRSYDDEVAWGSLGGRPQLWDNETQRQQAVRLKEKLDQGQSLALKEKQLIKSLNYQQTKWLIGQRAATATERSWLFRKKKKGGI